MATKCDEEFDLIKFFKGKAKVWLYFNVKQHKVSKKVIDNVAVCLKCWVKVKCPGGTTNLTSHVRRHQNVLNNPNLTKSTENKRRIRKNAMS